MAIFAEIIFDVESQDGDIEPYTMIARFRDREQLQMILRDNLLDSYIVEIEERLPSGYTIDSAIGFGEIYDASISYDIDLSILEM